MVKATCKTCGAAFEPKNSVHSYCTSRCASRSKATDTKRGIVTCAECGKEFQQRKAGQVACSTKCRARRYKRQIADQGEHLLTFAVLGEKHQVRVFTRGQYKSETVLRSYRWDGTAWKQTQQQVVMRTAQLHRLHAALQYAQRQIDQGPDVNTQAGDPDAAVEGETQARAG